ncbi:hypothetical protein G6F56_007711 [Rhizopus delemar]|nr:hypothetical protein G6F56_007711 [Rhizopus delemar]
MPVVVKLARQLYSLRLEEIQQAISKDEETFLKLVTEIEDIRAGKLDNQLMENVSKPAVVVNSNENSPKQPEELVQEVKEKSPSVMESSDQEEKANEIPKEEEIPVEPVKEETVNDEIKEDKGVVEQEDDQPMSNAKETPEQMEEYDMMNSSHKRLAENEDGLLGEPQLKRLRTEEPMMIQEEEKVPEPLTVDTIKTDYSTDVSQVTTPVDPKDGDESVGGNESNAPTPTNDRYSKKFNKEDPRQKSWLKNINLLWREIANHKNGAMFMNPIKESIAPQYYDIVKSPMDLKTIKNRIRDGFINTTTEFERDVILMLTNSLMYNTEGTEVYQMAREMLDDSAEKIRTFKTADEDSSASSHTRASSMAAKDRRKSFANEL